MHFDNSYALDILHTVFKDEKYFTASWSSLVRGESYNFYEYMFVRLYLKSM